MSPAAAKAVPVRAITIAIASIPEKNDFRFFMESPFKSTVLLDIERSLLHPILVNADGVPVNMVSDYLDIPTGWSEKRNSVVLGPTNEGAEYHITTSDDPDNPIRKLTSGLVPLFVMVRSRCLPCIAFARTEESKPL